MEKIDVLRRTGSPEQLFGVRDMILSGGKAGGTRAMQLYNASGMELLVLPDRGMDIAGLKLGGVNLSFLSKTGITAPAYFTEGEAEGFMRCFYAGFLTTGGLSYMGAPCREDERSLGLHGLVSNIPAREVRGSTCWKDDGSELLAEGTVGQAEVFGEHLVLSRRISLKAEENEFTIEDRVENRSLREAPFMILYHINFGYPFLDDGTEIHIPSEKTEARDEYARRELGDWAFMGPPDDRAEEAVFFHHVKTGPDGRAGYVVCNRRLGLGIQLSYPHDKLPWLTQWKCRRSGEYVLGLEPGNCHVLGRRRAREDGVLQYLKPLEAWELSIRVKGLSGDVQINRAIEEIMV